MCRISALQWAGLGCTVVVKHVFVRFTHVAEDRTWQHVGVVTHNAQSGWGGGGVEKNRWLLQSTYQCVYKKNWSQVDIFPSVASDDCLTPRVPSDPLMVSVPTSRCLYSCNHRSLSFSEGVNVTQVLWCVHSVYFLQRLNVYIVWKHVSVDKKRVINDNNNNNIKELETYLYSKACVSLFEGSPVCRPNVCCPPINICATTSVLKQPKRNGEKKKKICSTWIVVRDFMFWMLHVLLAVCLYIFADGLCLKREYV